MTDYEIPHVDSTPPLASNAIADNVASVEPAPGAFLEHALRYAAADIPVFPLKPRAKQPATAHGFKDATTDEVQVRAWWTENPNYNIGIPTGTGPEGAQLLVIDFDEERYFNAWIEAVGNAGFDVENAFCVQRTGNGYQVLLRCPDAGRNRQLAWQPADNEAGRSIAAETRARGGYIVADPSIHPGGNSYEVILGDITEIPVLEQHEANVAIELAENLCEAPLSKRQQETCEKATPRSTSYRSNGSASVIDRFNATYSLEDQLEQCGYKQRGRRWIRPDAAPDSQPGVWITTRDGKQVSYHHSSNDPLCDGHVHDAFSVYCRLQHGGNVHEAVRLAAGRLGMAYELDPPRISEGELEILPGGNLAGALENTPACNGVPAKPESSLTVSNSTPPTVEEAQFPPHLLHPPGLVGEICGWINRTAYKPQPILALGNALAFFGAVIGRKVRTRNLRTNLYILGVGESCSGKDHSRKQIKELCAAAGLAEEILGGEEVSSDSAILHAVYEHPTILFQFDEIGHMFATTTSKYSASHLRAVAPLLTKLFTSANTTFLGKEYANRKENPRKDIVNPCVSIFGTTVPGRLYEGLTPAEITDGFLGRMIVLQSDDPDPEERDDLADDDGPPDELVGAITDWWKRDDLPKAQGNLAELTQVLQLSVMVDGEAERTFRAFRDRCRGYRAQQRDQRGLDALWGRAVEHARKIALVVACGQQFKQPIITEEAARFGVELVEYATQRLLDAIKYGVACNDHERDVLKIHNAIRRATPKGGLSLSQLGRKVREIRARSRAEIIDQLIQSEDIAVTSAKNARGPAATIYVAR